MRAGRLAMGYSQETAAMEAEIAVSTWSKLENDEVDGPRLSTLVAVAAVIDRPLGWLISGRDG